MPGAVLVLIGIVLNSACSIPHEQWEWGCLFGLIADPYALIVGGIVASIGLLVALGDLRATVVASATAPWLENPHREPGRIAARAAIRRRSARAVVGTLTVGYGLWLTAPITGQA